MEYPDAPIFNDKFYEQPAWMIYCNGPRMHEFLREMNDQVLRHYDAVTIGELPHTPDPAHVLRYVSASDKQLSMVFQFDIVDIGQGLSYKYLLQDWKLPVLKKVIAKWQTFIEGTDGWTTAFCENHDQGRSVSRYASDAPEHRVNSAKLLAMMMAASTGTLFIYQGQEIGMVNCPRDWPIDEYKDIESLRFYRSMEKNLAKANGTSEEEKEAARKTLDHVMRSVQVLGRDNARLPMQWDDSPYAGFTIKPEGGWMRTHDNYRELNVARQLKDPTSVLAFWKRMLKIRNEYRDLFIYGGFDLYDVDNEKTFLFAKRRLGAAANDGGPRTAVVALNFTSEDVELHLPMSGLQLLIGNYEDVDVVEKGQRERTDAETKRKFRPWEGRLYLQK